MQLKELLVFGIVLAAASVNATGDGWCDYNVTKQTSMWGKTKNFLFKKSSPNMQLMRRCCQGYKLNEQKNCEAVCEQACPENAICSAPNKCQCRHGYKQVGVVGGNLECRAICMKNDCDCQPKHCECIEGVCQVVTAVANGGSGSDSSNEQPKIADEDSQGISTVEYAANEENEHPTTTLKPQSTTTSYTPTSSEGVEENCHVLGCHENAVCMDNGTCACLPGFTLFHATLVHYNAEENNDAEDDFGSSTTAANDFEATEWTTEYGDLTPSTTIRSHNTETLCLSSNDLQERLNILNVVSTASTASGEKSVANWQLPLLIALGCISTCFVLFLVVACTLRQRQRNTGKLDVEAKNELCCEYDNKNFTQKEMVY